MRKVFNYGVAIWIIANVIVFFLPSFLVNLSELTEINGDVAIASVNHVMTVINPMVAVVLGIIGLVSANKNNNSSD